VVKDREGRAVSKRGQVGGKEEEREGEREGGVYIYIYTPGCICIYLCIYTLKCVHVYTYM